MPDANIVRTLDLVPFDPKKYDVYLNGQGYRVQNIAMDSAPSLAPRFNTGEQGENDLDMLQTAGNLSFQGGMFQSELFDQDMVATIINGYVNPDNQKLYPTPAHETLEGLTADGEMTATAIYNDNLYVAVRDSADTINQIYEITEGGVIRQLTVPATLADASKITGLYQPKADNSLEIYSGNLVNDGALIHTYNWETDDITERTTNSPRATLGADLRGNYFTINDNSQIRQFVSGSSNVYEDILAIGKVNNQTNIPNSFNEFNHRIWVGKPTGLYSFDGLTSAVFLEAESNNIHNFKHTGEMHGWYYFNMDGYIWRHNSVTVERLRDFRDTDILGMSYGNDRIWVLTNGGQGSSVIDKYGWNVNDTNIWCFDGVGWFLYNNTQEGNAQVDFVQHFNNKIYTHFAGVPETVDGTIDTIDLSEEWQTGDKEVCVVIGSEMNNRFPNVPKYLESIEVDYQDLNIGDEITVSFRNREDNGSWTNWESGKNPISVASDNPKRFFITTYYIMQWQIIINKANSSSLSVESVYTHFNVQPERRKRWQVTFTTQGADYYNPEMLKDRSHETATPKHLREIIYDSWKREIPSIWLTMDYCILDQNIDASEIGSFKVKGTTNTMSDKGTVYIGTELMHYDGKELDSINVVSRGVWNSTASTHSTEDIVSEFHRVFVEAIVAEQFILNESDENTYTDNPDYGIESMITCQITEVNVAHEDS